MNKETTLTIQAKILVDRLGRLSADSIWARRASGLRASIDKTLSKIEKCEAVDTDYFEHLIGLGFDMLEKAGKEIPVPEDILSRLEGKP